MSASIVDGFSAWVSVSDVKLPQYGTETMVMEGKKMVHCWIISESQKEFAVGWTVPAHPEQLIGQVYVDHKLAGTRIHPLGKPGGPMTIKSMDVSDTSTAPEALVFPETKLLDEDVWFDIGCLGNIRVEIWVGRHLGPTPPPGTQKQLPTKTRGRAKKATSHRAIPGDEVAIASEKVQEWTRDRRIMCFEFDYRSRECLKEEGIIPFDFNPDARPQKRPAETPEPSTSEGEEETEAQLESEERRLCARREELRIQNKELEIQLDMVKAKRQKKKRKLETRSTNT